MINSIAFRLDDCSHEKKVSDFCNIVVKTPGWSSDKTNQVSIGTSADRLSGNLQQYTISGSNKSDDLRELLTRELTSEMIANVDSFWPAWRPKRIEFDESQSEYVLDELPFSISFHGSDSDLASFSIRSESGDCLVEIDGFAINSFEQALSTEGLVDGNLPRTDHHSKRQENVALYMAFLRKVIGAIRPHTVLTTQGGLTSYGAFGASVVYHRDSNEFIRDLLRSVWILDQYASILSESTGGNPWYDDYAWYFSDQQLRPEEFLNPDSTSRFANRITSVLDDVKSSAPASLEIPIVDQSLLSLSECIAGLADLLPAFEFEPAEVAKASEIIDVEELFDGILVSHKWYSLTQRFETFYHYLADFCRTKIAQNAT